MKGEWQCKPEQIKLVVKLAGALLLQEGELAVDDIRAMPFLTNPAQLDSVVDLLLRNFNAEVYSKRVASAPIPEWEQVIRLRV